MFIPQTRADRPITATKLIRVSQTGTTTIILEGDDEGLYQVQLANGGQTPKDITNAWVSGILARALGLPMTSQHCIAVGSRALRDEIIGTMRSDGMVVVPDHGMFLANRLTVGRFHPFSYLPRAYFSEVSNKADFVGMYLFDLWAQRRAARKVIYNRTGRVREIRATFVSDMDQFTGSRRHLESSDGPMCKDAGPLCEGLWTSKAVQGWMDALSNIFPKSIETAITSLPYIWQTDYAQMLGSSLQRRVQMHSSLLNVQASSMEKTLYEYHPEILLGFKLS